MASWMRKFSAQDDDVRQWRFSCPWVLKKKKNIIIIIRHSEKAKEAAKKLRPGHYVIYLCCRNYEALTCSLHPLLLYIHASWGHTILKNLILSINSIIFLKIFVNFWNFGSFLEIDPFLDFAPPLNFGPFSYLS